MYQVFHGKKFAGSEANVTDAVKLFLRALRVNHPLVESTEAEAAKMSVIVDTAISKHGVYEHGSYSITKAD